MSTIPEGRQRLELDSTWRAFKWDQADEFVGSMEQALNHLPGDGIKGADVVGVRHTRGQSRVLLIGEFKDFANPTIPAWDRAKAASNATSDKVLRDIVRKVVDTLSGATFSHNAQSQRSADLDGWRLALAGRGTSVLILVCVEFPRSQAVAHLAWTKALQQRLRWLGPNARVIVTTSARPFQGSGLRYAV